MNHDEAFDIWFEHELESIPWTDEDYEDVRRAFMAGYHFRQVEDNAANDLGAGDAWKRIVIAE